MGRRRMNDALLLFLGRDGGIEGWARIADGAIAERGAGTEGSEAHRSAPAIAVAPGEEVTLRWLDLPPGLSPAQAAGAARLAGERRGGGLRRRAGHP
jgi:hypothetical protein